MFSYSGIKDIAKEEYLPKTNDSCEPQGYFNIRFVTPMVDFTETKKPAFLHLFIVSYGTLNLPIENIPTGRFLYAGTPFFATCKINSLLFFTPNLSIKWRR